MSPPYRSSEPVAQPGRQTDLSHSSKMHMSCRATCNQPVEQGRCPSSCSGEVADRPSTAESAVPSSTAFIRLRATH